MKRLAVFLALLFWPFLAVAQDQAEADKGFLATLIQDNLSGDDRIVSINGFEGALSSNAHLDSLTVADSEGVWLRLEDVTLIWNRSALFTGRIEVEELSAAKIIVSRAPNPAQNLPSAEAQPFSLPELPVGISIGTLDVQRIELGDSFLGEPVALSLSGTAQLAGGQGSANVETTRLDGKTGSFVIDGSYDNATRDLALKLALNEGADGIAARLIGLPGRPSVALTIEGAGPVDTFAASLTLATDGQTRLTGQFQANAAGDAKTLGVNLRGDITPLFLPDYAAFFGPDTSLVATVFQRPGGGFDLTELNLAAQSIRLQGAASVSADGWPERLSLSGAIARDTGDPVLLPLAGPQTLVDRVDLNIGYDRARSDDWSAEFNISGLARPGLSVADVTVSGGGIIHPGPNNSTGEITANLTYGATGVQLDNAGAAEALGDTITGEFALSYTEGNPTKITRLTMIGPGIEVLADATIKGAEAGLQTQSNILLKADALERFSGLAGRQLGGAASLSLISTITPLDGLFDVIIAGETDNLAVGMAQLDPLLQGPGRISVNAVRDTAGTRLNALSIDTPEASVKANATLTSTASAATFDIGVRDVGLVLEGVTGPATLRGSADVNTPGTATFDVTGTAPGVDLSATGTADPAGEGQTVSIKATTTIRELADYATLIGQPVSGSVAVDISGVVLSDGMRFDVDVAARTQDLQTGNVKFDQLLRGAGVVTASIARIGTDRFALRDFNMKTPELSVVANATGSMTADIDAQFDVSVTNAQAVAPGLTGPLRIAGTAQRAVDGAGAANVTLRATGADITLDATTTSFDAGYDISGTLTAAIADLRPFQRLAGRAVSGGLDARVTGTVRPDLSLFDVRMDGTTDNLKVGIDRLDPLLAGAGTVSGRAARTGVDAFALQDLRVTTPQMRLSADATGGLAATSQAELDLEISDAGVVAPGLSGPLTATLRAARDAGEDATVVARISGSGTSTAIDATIAPPAKGYEISGTVTSQIDNLRPYQRLIGRTVAGALDVNLQGRALPDLSRFDIAAAIDTDNLSIGNTTADRLLAGRGTLRATAAMTAAGLSVPELSIQTDNVNVTGSLSADGGDGRGSFDARLRDVAVFTDTLSGPATATGTAALVGGNWSVDVAATGPGGIAADVTGQISGAGRLDLQLNGNLPLGLANAAIEPRRVDGTASFALAINGPPALSSLSGRISTNDGRLAAPTINQALSNISGDITLAGNRADISLVGIVENGGRVDVGGTVGLTAPFNGDVTARLNGVVLRDPTLYSTTIDGAINLNGALAGGARISGTVNLGETDVQVPSSGVGALGDLPQVEHVGADAAVRQTLARADAVVTQQARADNRGIGPAFPLAITINAPARIFIRGRGLDAELGGTLTLSGTSSNVIPAGEFRLIRGRLDILQQRFELTEGTASLQGDFTPYIRLVAASESANGTKVSIIVDGPANAPDVSFASSPELPQDEVLSLLIFGRDLSEISPLQAVQLAAAVGTLAGRGGGGIVDNFRQGIGLDDFDITTDQNGNAAVRAGKYLTENVYTDLTVSSDGSTDININLDVTDEVTAKGTVNADGETSIGIFYERDY